MVQLHKKGKDLSKMVMELKQKKEDQGRKIRELWKNQISLDVEDMGGSEIF